jgi:hypothetical protein
VARDWNNLEVVREDIFERMGAFGTNVAQFPYSETRELREGKLIWTVDIHIKVIRQTEFELTGEGETLMEALRRVYLGLNSQTNLRRATTASFVALPA